MYPVSQEFIDAMRSDKRLVAAKITIDYTSPERDQSVTVTVSERASISYPEQTADSVLRPTYKWASLDGSWTLDGVYHPAPTAATLTQHQMGWWGQQLAGVDGSFAAPYPALTVTHSPLRVQALRVVGDSAREEYPVDFTVDLYDQYNVLLHSETVTGNAALECDISLSTPVLGVAKQVLTITKWSHPGRQAKILEFFTSIQETYYSKDIMGLNLLEEREASQGSLPVGNISANEISLRLVNEDGKFNPDNDESPLYGLLKPNRRIRAWLGINDEWVPLGMFWSLDWDSPDDIPEAIVTARDRLELMRKSTYQPGAIQQNVSLYALAEQVILNAGVQPSEYIIDTALQQTVIPWAWLAPTTHREALRIIAEAALAVAYVDRDGRIRVGAPIATIQQEAGVWYIEGSPFPAEMTAPIGLYGIGPDDYFSPLRTPSQQNQVANEIIVTTQPLRPATAPEEVYRSTTPISVPAGQTITVRVQYSQPPVIEAVASLDNPPADVSIMTTTYYAWGAEVTIQNTSGSAADVTLVITGRPLSVRGGEQVITRDEASIAENGVLRYEFPANPLVQTLAQAQAIANALLASIKDPRRDIEFEWRGNPALELGDIISVVTDVARDRRSTYAVIRQEIEWGGYLSARLTGRRIT